MSDFLSKITAPVPGDSPFGADVNYDTDYERLKSEMGKLGDIDVNAVEALSLKILSTKSKDTRVMAWLAYAALRKGDVGRLADVFCALADYCTDSFEQIFPPREGAKLAALRWFSEARFSSQCPKADVSVDDAGDVARLKDALLKLRPALEKRFSSSGAPFPLILYKRVTEWEKSIETAIQSAKQVDESVDPSVDQSAAQSINRPVDQSPNPAGQPVTPKSTASSTDNPQAPVVIKLNHGEYQKILDCIETIKTLIKERR